MRIERKDADTRDYALPDACPECGIAGYFGPDPIHWGHCSRPAKYRLVFEIGEPLVLALPLARS